MRKKSLAQQDKELMKHIKRAWCVTPPSAKTVDARSLKAYGEFKRAVHNDKPIKMYEAKRNIRETKVFNKCKEFDDWRLYV